MSMVSADGRSENSGC